LCRLWLVALLAAFPAAFPADGLARKSLVINNLLKVLVQFCDENFL